MSAATRVVRFMPVADVGIGAGYILRSGSEIAAGLYAILRERYLAVLLHFMRSYSCVKPKRNEEDDGTHTLYR